MTRHSPIGVALLPFLLVPFLTSPGYSGVHNAAQSNPVPLVNTPLVPDSVAPGGPDLKLTVNGAGFVPSSVVLWNGTPLTTNFVSNSQLTATVPAADTAAPGTADVSVMNASPGGGLSNAVIFDIRVPFSAASFGQGAVSADSAPNAVITADLNGDGEVDLATILSEDSVGVFVGNGDGTFQSPVAYAVAKFPLAVVAADLNADGKLDLAASTSSGFVSVLLGNGDGTFQSHIDFDIAGQGISLIAGDLNQDGRLDIAVALTTGQVGILLGNGDGTFQQAAYYRAGSNRAFGLATGDFNKDGKLDLAATVWSDDAVAILQGNGDGTFQVGTEYPTQDGPRSLVTADFNGDGTLDLAVQTFDSVSVLLGKGDGTFFAHVDYPANPNLSGYGIAAEDLNGDGRLDLIVPSPGRLSTFLGRGDGTFWNRSDFATGGRSLTVAAGDFDADGKLDLVTADSSDNDLSLLPQVTSVLSRTYLKFGNIKVGDKSTRKVTLSNIGDTSFSINRIAVVGFNSDGYSETNNCGSELAPGASCKITIVFAPAWPIHYRHARVKISDTAANVPQKVYLVGTGVD